MKPAKVIVALLGAAGCFLVGSWYGQRPATSEARQGERAILHYHCPMHPQYTSSKPGNAPCCGMRLEPVYAQAAHEPHGHSGDASGVLRMSAGEQGMLGIRTAAVERSSADHSIRLLGRVAADETRTYTVSAAVDGWIREVYPFSTGSRVRKDQPLATFYSKEFLPAQQQYFRALSSLDLLKASKFHTPEQVALTDVQVWSQEDSLESLGMSEVQIKELAQARKYVRNVVIRAPEAGFILSRKVSPGQRFLRGDELYRIAELSRVWILVDVFEREAQYIKPGQALDFDYQHRHYRAKVSEVLPQFDVASRTLKVRLETDNPGFALKPDMFLDVNLPVTTREIISVPSDAVVDTGLRRTVFVARGDGEFESRNVETGLRLGGRVEIISGLEAGEQIVVAGNFLIDSETRMKATGHSHAGGETMLAQDASKKAVDPVCGMEVDPRTAAGKSEYKGTTYYFCNGSCKRSFDQNPQKYLPKKSG